MKWILSIILPIGRHHITIFRNLSHSVCGGLNEKRPPKAHAFGYLIPQWWCYFRRLWEARLSYRKYFIPCLLLSFSLSLRPSYVLMKMWSASFLLLLPWHAFPTMKDTILKPLAQMKSFFFKLFLVMVFDHNKKVTVHGAWISSTLCIFLLCPIPFLLSIVTVLPRSSSFFICRVSMLFFRNFSNQIELLFKHATWTSLGFHNVSYIFSIYTIQPIDSVI